jgi:purine catabolism regulator
LLLVTRAVLADSGDEQLVPHLHDAGVAGLVVVFAPEPVPGPLPDALLHAADAFGVACITARAIAPSEVAAPLLADLLAVQSQRLDRVLEIHDRFATSAVAGGGAREIAETLHDLIGHTVWVIDGAGHVMTVVPNDVPVPTGAGVVRVPIRFDQHDEGAVIAAIDPAELDQDALVAVERAASAVAMRQAQARAVANTQERFAAFALEELISGQSTDHEELADRAASLGWDLTRPRAVLLASIDPPAEPRTVSRALGTIAAAARSALGPDAIVWSRSTTVAALIAPDGDSGADRRRLALALQRELDSRLKEVTVSIGVGKRVQDPLELAVSFVQARRAVDVGRWAKGRHVTEVFDDLGLERLLAACPVEELAEFVRHTIGALQDHDRQHRSELVTTLEAWLDTRNVAEAARRTFVHYNTFKNRLERIEQILGPVLTDAARSLECGVALHIARHHDVNPSPAASVPEE